MIFFSVKCPDLFRGPPCPLLSGDGTISLRGMRESQIKNLKNAIKIRNDAHGLMSGRQVAVRCRNATRRRSSSVRMAAPLATCTKVQRSVICFLSSEGAKPIEIHRRVEFSMVMHACHYSKCTSGLGSS